MQKEGGHGDDQTNAGTWELSGAPHKNPSCQNQALCVSFPILLRSVIQSLFSAAEPPQCVLFWTRLWQSSKPRMKMRSCGTEYHQVRGRVQCDSQETRQMSETLDDCSLIKAVYTIWTRKNRPRKLKEKMIRWQLQLHTFPFTQLEKSSGRNFLTERTENLYVILFQINLLAELKIWSTLPSIHYLTIAQKTFMCRMRVIF